jgi:hypothetical protein
MTEGGSEGHEGIELPEDRIDDLDTALNPIGRFYRHLAMHAGTIPMVIDEFGRCRRCLMLGFWRADA